MNGTTRSTTYSTVEEYLAFEEAAPERHEYVVGHVYAMTGASKRHNRIETNVFRALDDAAEGNPCRVYVEGVKLRVASDIIYYPDVMVACEPDEDPLVEHSPCVVIEVASPGTEATDRREKLLAYRQMDSLRAYLVVAQDRCWIEHHFRDVGGEWQHENCLDTGVLSLPCPPGARLSLEGVYRRTGVEE